MNVKKTVNRALTLAAVFLLLTGCGKVTHYPPDASGGNEMQSGTQCYTAGIDGGTPENGYPESYIINDDNYFDYQPGLECAAFSSAYVLRHFGEKADGLELFKNFPGKLTDGAGVFPSGVEQFWNERDGYTAKFQTGGTVDTLKQLVSTGVPVIVFVHVAEPYESPHNTHYLPLVGYDKDYFYFAESLEYLANCKDEPDLGYNRKTDLTKFERLWSNIDDVWDNPYFVITKE